MTLRREIGKMKRAPLKAEREFEATRNLIDILIVRDGVVYLWNGEGSVIGVEDKDIGGWEMVARGSPWLFKYEGWSARNKRHLWRRNGDKLDALYDVEGEIQEVRYEGQEPPSTQPPQGEQP